MLISTYVTILVFIFLSTFALSSSLSFVLFVKFSAEDGCQFLRDG